MGRIIGGLLRELRKAERRLRHAQSYRTHLAGDAPQYERAAVTRRIYVAQRYVADLKTAVDRLRQVSGLPALFAK